MTKVETGEAANALFQVLGPDKAIIRGQVFKVNHQDEPFSDGTKQTLEATTDQREKYGQFLEAHELRNVTASMLPMRFSLMLDYHVPSSNKQISSISETRRTG